MDGDGWTPAGDGRRPNRPTLASRRFPETGPLAESTLDGQPDGSLTDELLVPAGDWTAGEVAV